MHCSSTTYLQNYFQSLAYWAVLYSHTHWMYLSFKTVQPRNLSSNSRQFIKINQLIQVREWTTHTFALMRPMQLAGWLMWEQTLSIVIQHIWNWYDTCTACQYCTTLDKTELQNWKHNHDVLTLLESLIFDLLKCMTIYFGIQQILNSLAFLKQLNV